MMVPDQQAAVIWEQLISTRPSSAVSIMRKGWTPNQIDNCIAEYFPKEFEACEAYAKTFLIKYGLYEVPSSVVRLTTLARDVEVPLYAAYHASKKFGNSPELLECLGLRYIEVFDTHFEREHFFRTFGVKTDKAKSDFMDLYFTHHDTIKACEKYGIDVRARYKRMTDATEKAFKESGKLKKSDTNDKIFEV